MSHRIHYTERGIGPVLVALHGLGGDRTQWMNMLPDDFPFRVLFPDLPGHGETDWLAPELCTFDWYAHEVWRWLDALQITEQVPVAGISMGAGIALKMACQQPERVQKLILVRPAWLNHPYPENLSIFVRMGKKWAETSAADTMTWLQSDEGYLRLKAVNPACLSSVHGQLDRPLPKPAIRTLIEMPGSTPFDTPFELAELTCDVLVAGNEEDMLHPVYIAETTASLIPFARFNVVAPRYTSPANHNRDVFELLAAFLV
ncbi:alpha/beta fold hydrolase [Arsenicibacter rosenii]|uniref:AB hydrolase-1 domain-containing protein n=1 Tax=Arsenicibacter rosenii TaxID=1750698 RepID=A0A1S2VA95_9BACT|nr:alpha/beta hydrolase [Arsenicibacter rosenii]OIN55667.1 hypothetical protein BLX24_28850 [Arsenicibacter rosenii]